MGVPFCQTTYLLDGDCPLIFIAYGYMHDLDLQLELGIELSKMDKAAGRAAEIMALEAAKFDATINETKASVASVALANTELVSAERKLKELKEKANEGVRCGGRARNATERGADYFGGDAVGGCGGNGREMVESEGGVGALGGGGIGRRA